MQSNKASIYDLMKEHYANPSRSIIKAKLTSMEFDDLVEASDLFSRELEYRLRWMLPVVDQHLKEIGFFQPAVDKYVEQMDKKDIINILTQLNRACENYLYLIHKYYPEIIIYGAQAHMSSDNAALIRKAFLFLATVEQIYGREFVRDVLQ